MLLSAVVGMLLSAVVGEPTLGLGALGLLRALVGGGGGGGGGG